MFSLDIIHLVLMLVAIAWMLTRMFHGHITSWSYAFLRAGLIFMPAVIVMSAIVSWMRGDTWQWMIPPLFLVNWLQAVQEGRKDHV